MIDSDPASLLAFAERKLVHAEKIFAIELWDSAGREAYHAALAAARAVIVHSGRRLPKTHNGTQKVFSDLIREGLTFDVSLAKFLSSGFEIKSAVDYADGAPIDERGARDAIEIARRFIAAAKAVCA